MPPITTSLYPRARENRKSPNDPAVRKARFKFLRASGNNFILLQLLFLGLFCYIFGSLFQQTNHTHNLSIVLVDYDGGAIGRAIRAAYAALRGDSFPTLIERPPSDFPVTGELWNAVCKTEYWAALYVNPGASARLEAALSANSATASSYDPANVMAYIWNEALYPQVVDASISANIQLLSDAARVAYTTGNGTGKLTSVSGPAALSVLAQPWHLQSLNIQPTAQGSRAIYNTVTILLVLIQEFYYLGTLNGLYARFKLYPRLDPYRIIAVRNLNSLAYTFVGSLCVAGTIWAFRADWAVNGVQFVLSWVTLWLFAHVNFLVLDVVTVWLPQAYVPMALVSWIIFNVTSVLLPFELSPAFYRVGYAMPAREVYTVLTHVWSRGCNPHLGYALPVLFAWEAVGLAASGLGVFRRCHFATVAEERLAREFAEKVDAAVAVEMGKLHEERKMLVRRGTLRREGREEKDGREEVPVAEAGAVGGGGGGVSGDSSGYGGATPAPEDDMEHDEHDVEHEAFQEQLAGVIERVNTNRSRREQERNVPVRNVNFGPSFDLPFGPTHEAHESDEERMEHRRRGLTL